MNEKEFFEQFRYDPEKDLLGSGGFGSVYRAYDLSKNRYVAIKISQVKDIFGKFTLLNEVKLSQEIDDHANVARYEFGLRVKLPFPVDYAVMAYYEEGNLDMVLKKKQGVLTPKEQFEIIEGLLEGIHHLHNENVIHRDLKLANILMLRTKQGQWRPKIADFGLSRQMDSYDSSIANSAIGITIAYAAPEQIENKPIRKNVDLWAIGVVIYRILTGEMPFAVVQEAEPTSATVEISRKITQVELPPKLDTLSEPYQSIIRRCWVKDIKDRAQSALELLSILRNNRPASVPISTPQVDTVIPTTTATQEVVNDDLSATLLLENEEAAEMPAAAPPSVFEAKTADRKVPPIDEATIIEQSYDEVDNSDKTMLDPQVFTSQNRTKQKSGKSFSENLMNNKGKAFIGAGLLCLLLGFVICNKNSQPNTVETKPTTQVETSVPTILADNTNQVGAGSNTNSATTNPSNVPVEAKKEIEKPTESASSEKTTEYRSSEPVDKVGDFALKVICCCHQLNGGTITIKNFRVESSGKVSFPSNTSITIVNRGAVLSETPECQEKILSVFQRYFRWSSGGSAYTKGQYVIEY